MEKEVPTEKSASVHFYEDRYRHGYMGYWSSFEQKRIFQLVKELKLPEKGKFLDFGCGRGIFTAVLAKALPEWEIYGCDVSQTAITVAAKNNPGGKFYLVSDPALQQHRFDFIHSHHVLEHTADLEESIRLMFVLAAPSCKMLHSLPCNHAGSLEEKVSASVKGGINKNNGTFFFEDSAHLRRLSEEQLSAKFKSGGFALIGESYSNQYYGAVKWISESNLPLIMNFTKNNLKLRAYLLFTWFCFFVAGVFDQQDKGRFYYIKRSIQLIFALFFFWLGFSVRAYINYRAKKEWKKQRSNRAGSEMFLSYQR